MLFAADLFKFFLILIRVKLTLAPAETHQPTERSSDRPDPSKYEETWSSQCPRQRQRWTRTRTWQAAAYNGMTSSPCHASFYYNLWPFVLGFNLEKLRHVVLGFWLWHSDMNWWRLHRRTWGREWDASRTWRSNTDWCNLFNSKPKKFK